MSSKSPKERFPIHWLVWHNQYDELDKELAKSKVRVPVIALILVGFHFVFEPKQMQLKRGGAPNDSPAERWGAHDELMSLWGLFWTCVLGRHHLESFKEVERIRISTCASTK